MTVETPETVAARIRRALPHVPAERIVVAPDCGLKYLPREVAFGKMRRWSRAPGLCGASSAATKAVRPHSAGRGIAPATGQR